MFFDQSTLIVWLRTHSFQQLSAGQYGGTFVDWSINYLCNVDKHTVVEFNGYDDFPIPSNPIASTGSAHRHIRNHSGNPGEILWQWHFLNTHYPKNLHTFYLHTPNPWRCKFKKNYLDMVRFTEYIDHYLQFVINFFFSIFSMLIFLTLWFILILMPHLGYGLEDTELFSRSKLLMILINKIF